MDPGRLNEKFAFDSRGPKVGGLDDGNTEDEFIERFVLSAERVFLRGTEAVMASRLESRQPVTIRVWASSISRQITTDWQMRDVRTGVVYAIRSAVITSDRSMVEILGESGVAP